MLQNLRDILSKTMLDHLVGVEQTRLVEIQDALTTNEIITLLFNREK